MYSDREHPLISLLDARRAGASRCFARRTLRPTLPPSSLRDLRDDSEHPQLALPSFIDEHEEFFALSETPVASIVLSGRVRMLDSCDGLYSPNQLARGLKWATATQQLGMSARLADKLSRVRGRIVEGAAHVGNMSIFNLVLLKTQWEEWSYDMALGTATYEGRHAFVERLLGVREQALNQDAIQHALRMAVKRGHASIVVLLEDALRAALT